tara:strand:- start:121 stop:903 length:783 start_codon:yes stop_codon:yes gene_type:complete
MTKKKDFTLDKAFMAVKAQRYEEAMLSYENSLEKKASVEAWVGLGIAKLFQLLDNQTMEEVIFCFTRAKEVGTKNDQLQIEQDLINYSTIVVERGVSYCLQLIEEIQAAEKAAANAAIITALASVASFSSSGRSSIISGVAAGAAGGVTAGKLKEVQSSKEAALLTIDMIKSVIEGLKTYNFSEQSLKDVNNKIIYFNTLGTDVDDTASGKKKKRKKIAKFDVWLAEKWYVALSIVLLFFVFPPIAIGAAIYIYFKHFKD